MAITVTRSAMPAPQSTEATLLNAVGATSDGEWIEVRGLRDINVHVTGITSATVQIHVSNAPTKPSDATDGIVVGSVTAAGIVYVLGPVKWIKAKISAWSSGTISAYLEGI